MSVNIEFLFLVVKDYFFILLLVEDSFTDFMIYLFLKRFWFCLLLALLVISNSYFANEKINSYFSCVGLCVPNKLKKNKSKT